MKPTTLIAAADALTMFATTRDAIRAGHHPSKTPAQHSWLNRPPLDLLKTAQAFLSQMAYIRFWGASEEC